MSKSHDAVENRVIAIVAEFFGVDNSEVKMDVDLSEAYGANSLDMVQLAIECEDEFDLLPIPDEEAGKIHTASDLVTLAKNGGQFHS